MFTALEMMRSLGFAAVWGFGGSLPVGLKFKAHAERAVAINLSVEPKELNYRSPERPNPSSCKHPTENRKS